MYSAVGLRASQFAFVPLSVRLLASGTGPAPAPARCTTPCTSPPASGVPATTTSPPPLPPSGPEVDDPVGRLDHVEVVLDDDDRVARVDEAVQHFEQLAHVLEVQAVVGSSRM